MATIKAIEGRSVHQIQSGQVIVDLCSVVKELVENSLDAGATSVEVRFKTNGLELIEVHDNGGGIAPDDFETVALKHYTSKLSTYDDLDSLQTFGFRGEALSSLCALSRFHIVTARASDGPKGSRLEFDISGKLKNTSIVASQKGTTVSVENIFHNLPVRRKELEKNIKREYGKVLALLHAYACISTAVRFAVSNQQSKGKKIIVFSTKSNPTTKENIANVYGAKTLLALIPLDLELEMQPGLGPPQTGKNWSTQGDGTRQVRVLGHISRPVVGEGRQTPDRQMFFVNSRPCGLPQVAKAINEVYKSYNVTQSPFIFADLRIDTNHYDVNVSPDKRTILLHDQTALLESLKKSLAELFEKHDQSVPQARLPSKKLPIYRPLTVNHDKAAGLMGSKDNEKGQGVPDDLSTQTATSSSETPDSSCVQTKTATLIQDFTARNADSRIEQSLASVRDVMAAKEKEKLAQDFIIRSSRTDRQANEQDEPSNDEIPGNESLPRFVKDFNKRMASQQAKHATEQETSGRLPLSQSTMDEGRIPSIHSTPSKTTPGPVINAFDRMRPMRTPVTTATITIGDTTTVTTIGTPAIKRRRVHTPKYGPGGSESKTPLFGKALRDFAAPGSQVGSGDENSEDSEDGLESSAHPAQASRIARSSSPSESGVDLDIEDGEGRDGGRLRRGRDGSPLFEPDSQSEGHNDVDDKGDDNEYVDEEEKKTREEERIAKMIQAAEKATTKPTQDNLKRAAMLLRSRTRKDSTLQLMHDVSISVMGVERITTKLTTAMNECSLQRKTNIESNSGLGDETSAEERLSLIVSKADFSRMRIIGQFNLGFILATRPALCPGSSLPAGSRNDAPVDELFIIDQHASDEKFNFERLQAETVVQNQRLVRPRVLELTALEEEVIINHSDALAKNGFHITVDLSGESPVGQRCKLVSLPMSREVVFDIRDLEELLSLLAEAPVLGSEVPRPGKVRRMFAMRACRSSIMVGKVLTTSRMEKVVKNMGAMEKPWNCPHGRPTMRHLAGLSDWQGWSEGDGVVGLEGVKEAKTDWRAYLARARTLAAGEWQREGWSDDGYEYELGIREDLHGD